MGGSPTGGAAGVSGATDAGGTTAGSAGTGGCPDCAACSDGIQNHGEAAADCGGPCGRCWQVYGCGMCSCTEPCECGTAYSSQPLTVVPSVHSYLGCASVDVHLPDGSDFWGPSGGFYQLFADSVVVTELQ
jgi:hypothetical protein